MPPHRKSAAEAPLSYRRVARLPGVPELLAVSMSLNLSGLLLGSALGGLVAAHSLRARFAARSWRVWVRLPRPG